MSDQVVYVRDFPYPSKMQMSKRVFQIHLKSLKIATLYTLVQLVHLPCTLDVNALYSPRKFIQLRQSILAYMN